MTEKIRVEAGSSQPQQDRRAPPLQIWLELILHQAPRCNRPSSWELHCTRRQAPRFGSSLHPSSGPSFLEARCTRRQAPRLDLPCTLRQAPRWKFIAPCVRTLVVGTHQCLLGPLVGTLVSHLLSPLSAPPRPPARCAPEEKRGWRMMWIGAGLGLGARGHAGLCATVSSCGSCCRNQLLLQDQARLRLVQLRLQASIVSCSSRLASPRCRPMQLLHESVATPGSGSLEVGVAAIACSSSLRLR
jgi:hypothetical protein